MCRLFGFRSVIPSQVHRSLMSAENALCYQSNQHPDGWGVAFYVDGAPHLTRSASTAVHDQLFHRLSGIVASETVLAHVRKATQGPINVLNCHPFQHGRWTFAHNGDVSDFARHREALLDLVDARLRRYVLGDTDSEVIFYLVLSELARRGPLAGSFAIGDLEEALGVAVEQVRGICDAEKPSLLTVVLTNGTSMVAAMGGKELFWSTYKKRCGDRESCSSLAPECEAPTVSGHVNHLVLSSEPIVGENVWSSLAHDEVVGVDEHMRLHRGHLGRRRLSIVA